jgi:hypothetical protein
LAGFLFGFDVVVISEPIKTTGALAEFRRIPRSSRDGNGIVGNRYRRHLWRNPDQHIRA